MITVEDCRPTWARSRQRALVDNLFGRRSSGPVSIQLFGDPVDPYGSPFAIVQRFHADQSRPATESEPSPGHTIFNPGSERTSARWVLPDGSEAYLNTRDLPDDVVVAVATALQPRHRDATVPGFDLPDPPGRLELLDEAVTSFEIDDIAMSACSLPTGAELKVAVVDGRPLARFMPLIDHPAPLPVGLELDGERVLVAFGTRGTDPRDVLDRVRQSSAAEWAGMLSTPSSLDGFLESTGHRVAEGHGSGPAQG